MVRDFNALLKAQWGKGSFLCIGLDPDIEKIPKSVDGNSARETIGAFNRAIIDATKGVAAAYKPNSAFYEAHGEEGYITLRETILYSLEQAPNAVVILDAKRADIGNTNLGYVGSAFERLQADAITLHPYLGKEAIQPFLDRKEKGIFILCRTSNPGATEFQDLPVAGEPLYMQVARRAQKWNENGNCGLVVGATYPKEIADVRSAAPKLPFLIPGVGAQGGDLAASVRAAKNADGGFLLSVSRGVLYASSKSDFAEAATIAAKDYDTEIRSALNMNIA